MGLYSGRLIYLFYLFFIYFFGRGGGGLFIGILRYIKWHKNPHSKFRVQYRHHESHQNLPCTQGRPKRFRTVACVAGARRGRGIGEIRRALERSARFSRIPLPFPKPDFPTSFPGLFPFELDPIQKGKALGTRLLISPIPLPLLAPGTQAGQTEGLGTNLRSAQSILGRLDPSHGPLRSQETFPRPLRAWLLRGQSIRKH